MSLVNVRDAKDSGRHAECYSASGGHFSYLIIMMQKTVAVAFPTAGLSLCLPLMFGLAAKYPWSKASRTDV